MIGETARAGDEIEDARAGILPHEIGAMAVADHQDHAAHVLRLPGGLG